MQLRRIAALGRVEGLRLLVDRTSLGLILAVPAVQLILFGYAVNLTPRNVPLAIARSCDAYAAQIMSAAADTGSFNIIMTDPAVEEASRYISDGRAEVAIGCRSGEAPHLLADASDPITVRPAVAALGSALARGALRSLLPADTRVPSVQWLYNPDLRTAWFIAPGLVGVIVMITTLMLGALTVIREREQGSWEGLLATPVTAAEALLGKLSPYLLIAVVQAAIVLALARVLFGLPVLGSVNALLVASAALALAHLTLGFSLSALAETQIQAVQAAVFFYLPSMLLSGFMFPAEAMPRWARFIGDLLPLTHFVRAARGVLLKGYGATAVSIEMWPVAVFAVVAALIALASFRRRLS
ncbi:MAG: ABC transporter permease [Gammaproteobacteria bacterium]|nr:ABC transporter permease [Gammaproteobacteria bacterium]